jgi:hypothetical protein
MTPADKKRAARRAVTERLRLFYKELEHPFADGIELLRRAEKKAAGQPKPNPDAG